MDFNGVWELACRELWELWELWELKEFKEF